MIDKFFVAVIAGMLGMSIGVAVGIVGERRGRPATPDGVPPDEVAVPVQTTQGQFRITPGTDSWWTTGDLTHQSMAFGLVEDPREPGIGRYTGIVVDRHGYVRCSAEPAR